MEREERELLCFALFCTAVIDTFIDLEMKDWGEREKIISSRLKSTLKFLEQFAEETGKWTILPEPKYGFENGTDRPREMTYAQIIYTSRCIGDNLTRFVLAKGALKNIVKTKELKATPIEIQHCIDFFLALAGTCLYACEFGTSLPKPTDLFKLELKKND